jgi:hypothetical protein
MAKQVGDIKIWGSIDGLCFYAMEGTYYVRKSSSLSGKRFWKDKAFEGSRRSCNWFSEGNRLASKLYKRIEKEKKDRKIFRFLLSRAIDLIKQEKPLYEVEALLVDYLESFGFLQISTGKGGQGQSKDIDLQKESGNLHDDIVNKTSEGKKLSTHSNSSSRLLTGIEKLNEEIVYGQKKVGYRNVFVVDSG